MHAARTKVGGVQPRTASTLVEHHELLAFLEPPERRGQGSHIQCLRRHVQQVVQDAPDLRIQDPDQRCPTGNLGAGQPFDREAPSMFLVHWRHVVQPVEIWQVLEVGAAFHQLLGAAMKKADMRVAALDNLSVKLQHQPKHAMSSRVLRPEIDVEVPELLLSGQGVVNLAVHHSALSGR